jgi:cytoskeletal protein CcmA (bactofilin family)
MAFKDDISMHTVIGLGAAISGDVRGNGLVRIDGDIDGNFETTGQVIIGPQARIRGNVTAKSAIIHGVIIGDVQAEESIHLISSAAVIGDISTRALQVDENVIINGHCLSITEPAAYAEKDKLHKEAKAIRSRAISIHE